MSLLNQYQKSLLSDYPYRSSLFDVFYPSSKLSSINTVAGQWSREETGDELTLEIPGYGREDISIKVKDAKTLTIQIAEKQYYSYKIKQYYDLEKISASADKGILKVFLPFKEKEQSSEIEITID